MGFKMRSPFLNGDDKLPDKTEQKNNNKNVVDLYFKPSSKINYPLLPSIAKKPYSISSAVTDKIKKEETDKIVKELQSSPEWKIRQQQWKNSSGAITSGVGNIAFDEFKKNPEGVLNFFPYAGEAIDAKNTVKDLSKGDYVGAFGNAAGLMLPFVPGNFVKGVLKTGLRKLEDVFGSAGSRLSKTGRAEAKLLKDPNFVRVYTPDGSSKIMDKKFTTKLYRTEDANISNKLYDKAGVKYNTYNWAGDNPYSQVFYNKKTKSAFNPDVQLKPEENRRFFEMYFDKADAKMFSVDAKNAPDLATKMSKASGEYVIPPSIMQDIRERGSGYGFQVSKGSQDEIIERLFGKSNTFSTFSKVKD